MPVRDMVTQRLSISCIACAWLQNLRQDRSNGRGSGVMIYIRDHFKCQQICWPSNHDLECLGLNVMLSPEMSFIPIVVYRPPSFNNDFIPHLKNCFKHVI